MLPDTPIFAQTVDTPITTDDVDSIKNDTAWWDPNWDNCIEDTSASNTAATSLAGKDNIQKSYNFFISKGLQNFQSAGIVGNLRQESGSNINPKSHQEGGGPGRGIAQWSVNERWVTLTNWAQKANRDPWALDTQLDFIWYEGTTAQTWGQTIPAVKATTTLEAATQAFEDKYEKAGQPQMQNRINYAKEVMQWYGGGGTPGAPVGTTENTSAGDSCGGNGSGILVDGYAFPVAPQTKRDYTTLPCKAGKNTSYTDRYGKTSLIATCHHDGSPAFDLMYSGVAGVPVYAITDGTIVKVNTSYVMNSSVSGKACASIQFQANHGSDHMYYWYGHILKPSVSPGQQVKAGDQIAVVATEDYGPKCWGGGPHLHIDRGCVDKSKNPQQAGYDSCRDPSFLTDLKLIWDKLPEAK